MTSRPLYPGPVEDGAPTWFCRFDLVPDHHQWRVTEEGTWVDINAPDVHAVYGWVQVRRRPPSPSDHVLVHDAAHRGIGDGCPVTFAEVCETIVGAIDADAETAMAGQDRLTETLAHDPVALIAALEQARAEAVSRVSLAVWQLLVEGQVPGDG